MLLDGQLLATVSVYRIEQDNLAVADGFIPGTPIQAYRGAKGTVAKGYELEVVGKITPQWDVSAGWSDYSAKDASWRACARAPAAPRVQLRDAI